MTNNNKSTYVINKDFLYQIIASKDSRYLSSTIITQYDSLKEAQSNYIKVIDKFKEFNDGYKHYGIKEIKRNE